MKLAPPFEAAGHHVAVDLPGARAVFTTRRGGYSSGPYESLNLGRLTDDQPGLAERNRALLESELGVALAYVRQVHGTGVVRLAERNDEPLLEADGQATALRGIAPTVLTADCLPIAVASAGAVAMLHAGWRGLAGGVIDEGVRALRELGEDGPLQAAIGPGAGGCCYEVGDDVRAAFEPSAHRGANLDLKAVARARLETAGVGVVHDVGLCTICSPRELFFSHRRDHGQTGRQAGIVWRI